MENKQTAVEWLIKQINNKPLAGGWSESQITISISKDIINQAKQMEKEQITKAWDDGDYAYFHSKETGRDFENGEEYYNEIYKP